MTAQNPGSGLTSAASSLGERALKIFAERVGQRSGTKLGASQIASRVVGKFTDMIGTKIPDAMFDRAGEAASIFIQDPGLWKSLVVAFGMNPAMAQDITNEGIDHLMMSFLDAAKTHQGKSGKELDEALYGEADQTLDHMTKHVETKYPHLVKKVWYDPKIGFAHEIGCENIEWKRGAQLGPVRAGITLGQVLQNGGRMASECDCVGARRERRGNLQEAIALCDGDVRTAFTQVLTSKEIKPLAAKILAGGAKQITITADNVVDVVEHSNNPNGTPNREAQLIKLLALTGTERPSEQAKNRSSVFANLEKRGLEVIKNLFSRRDSSYRTKLRAKMDARIADVHATTKRIKGHFGK